MPVRIAFSVISVSDIWLGSPLDQVPPRSKLVRDPRSFGYRRLLPFLNEMTKNGNTLSVSLLDSSSFGPARVSCSYAVSLHARVLVVHQIAQSARRCSRKTRLCRTQRMGSADLILGWLMDL